MSEYRPPLDDIDFVLTHIVDLAAVSKLDGFQHSDPETVRSLLEEAGRFFSEVIAPLNRVGDRVGSRLLPDGSVKTPDGFRQAYAKFVEAGWAGAHIPEEWGGGGLPYTVGIVLQEMFKTANMAFSLGPMLTQAAIEALIKHGTEEQRRIYLEKLVRGTWTGTMCLTEPQAGSDLGLLTTRAEPQSDGSYRLFGQKIFITWGEHDLTENIVHLVLARTPGSPPGTRGISMFLVPKLLPNPDGSLGRRNDLRILSLEHKLGIHASPTCVVAFGDGGEGATGYLIGDEQAGMQNMFTMMNTARIGVGIEGLAMGERAYQQALAFARERRQGRAPGAPATETSLIVEHPDVRRMLLTIRAYNQAMRCLLYSNARAVDMERHAESAEERELHRELAAFLTPITKAWCTDLGIELTSLGLQVHGGMGYVEETGAAQLYRDARIATIYEGTNGIQAIDLVTRKLPMRKGAVADGLLSEVEGVVPSLPEPSRSNLGAAVAALRVATDSMLSRLATDPSDALAGATPYLRMWGTVLGGWFMARSLLAAQTAAGDPGFLRVKLATARFYLDQILPQAPGLLGAVTAPVSALVVE